MNKLLIIALMVILSISSFSAPKIDEILHEIDVITELKTDGTAKVDIVQKKVNQGVKKLESIYYRRDSDDAFLIIMTAPEIEKGNGYLRSGDNFWMYKRNTRTFQHVNRDESIAGTNSTGEDFEDKDLTEMYQAATDENGNEIIEESKLGNVEIYKFKVKARIDDVSYPVKVYYVRKDNYLPLKEESYALSGTLMQTAYFTKYTKLEGKYLWVRGMFIDEFEKGNKTMVEIKDISLEDIDDYIFTKAYLENLSK